MQVSREWLAQQIREIPDRIHTDRRRMQQYENYAGQLVERAIELGYLSDSNVDHLPAIAAWRRQFNGRNWASAFSYFAAQLSMKSGHLPPNWRPFLDGCSEVAVLLDGGASALFTAAEIEKMSNRKIKAATIRKRLERARKSGQAVDVRSSTGVDRFPADVLIAWFPTLEWVLPKRSPGMSQV